MEPNALAQALRAILFSSNCRFSKAPARDLSGDNSVRRLKCSYSDF